MIVAATAAVCDVGGAAPARFDGKVEAVPVAGGAIMLESLGDGPALLFVHGWTLDRRAWTFQAESFAARFRMLAFDRRGCGQSTAAGSLAAEPDDVATVLDRAGMERCIIVAMSQGTRIALAFASRNPGRVAGLVLQGTPSLLPDGNIREEPVPVAAMMRCAREERWADLRRIWRGHPLLALPGGKGRELLDTILRDYRGRDLLSTGEPLVVAEEALASIATPTLLVCGEHETPARKAAAERLATLLPSARAVEVSGGGHLCNLCSPDPYNAVLRDFLGSVRN